VFAVIGEARRCDSDGAGGQDAGRDVVVVDEFGAPVVEVGSNSTGPIIVVAPGSLEPLVVVVVARLGPAAAAVVLIAPEVAAVELDEYGAPSRVVELVSPVAVRSLAP
jgi:hypothetical protein